MMVWVGATVSLASAAACSTNDSGVVGADATGTPGCASLGAGAAVDGSAADVVSLAGGDAGRCDPDAAFGPIIRVPGVESFDPLGSATLTADELQVVYESFDGPTGDGGYVTDSRHIYIATRPDRHSSFVCPTLLANIGNAAAPRLSADGMTFLLDVGGDIYWTTRASPADVSATAFAPPQPIAGVDVAGGQDAGAGGNWPALTADGLTLYFSRGFPLQIYRASASNAFATPSPIAELGTLLKSVQVPADAPLPTADDLGLYFGVTGSEGNSIFLAHRKAIGLPYDSLSRVDELSDQASTTRAEWISPDGCRIYVAKAGNINAGNAAISGLFFAARGCTAQMAAVGACR
jgi:hypothetical protein